VFYTHRYRYLVAWEEVKVSHTLGGGGEWDTQEEGSGHEMFVSWRVKGEGER
jgi:hypothetical protein